MSVNSSDLGLGTASTIFDAVVLREADKQLQILLGKRHIIFPPAQPDVIEDLKRLAAQQRERLDLQNELFKQVRDPKSRYEFEYMGDDGRPLYYSHKEGIDNGMWGYMHITEIGGGPGNITLQAPASGRCCIDIVGHPEHERNRIKFLEGSICDGDIVERATSLGFAGPESGEPKLVVLSYVLDRVPSQIKALHNFAQLMKLSRAVGLITVCLPAEPQSPGSNISYAEGEGGWFTLGNDPIVQYAQIVAACAQEGLQFVAGGLTIHYGVSAVDGYEELPCYVLYFEDSLSNL